MSHFSSPTRTWEALRHFTPWEFPCAVDHSPQFPKNRNFSAIISANWQKCNFPLPFFIFTFFVFLYISNLASGGVSCLKQRLLHGKCHWTINGNILYKAADDNNRYPRSINRHVSLWELTEVGTGNAINTTAETKKELRCQNKSGRDKDQIETTVTSDLSRLWLDDESFLCLVQNCNPRPSSATTGCSINQLCLR